MHARPLIAPSPSFPALALARPLPEPPCPAPARSHPAPEHLNTRTPEHLILGDIVICGPVAERQAEAAGHSVAAEVEWLLLHGTLHLLGYDDATPEGLAEMVRRQREVLADVGGSG